MDAADDGRHQVIHDAAAHACAHECSEVLGVGSHTGGKDGIRTGTQRRPQADRAHHVGGKRMPGDPSTPVAGRGAADPSVRNTQADAMSGRTTSSAIPRSASSVATMPPRVANDSAAASSTTASSV